MGIFNRKREEVIVKQETETVEGAEVWMVSWNARFGSYVSDVKRVAKAFLNENDADTFIESLHKAAKLLQYNENLGIKKERQE